MRQETGKCSISYEPCDENSFGIGPTHSNGMPGGIMTGTGGMGTSGSTLSDPGQQAGMFLKILFNILRAFQLIIDFSFSLDATADGRLSTDIRSSTRTTS